MRNFFIFILLFWVVSNPLSARDWLQPLPSREDEAFILEDFRFVPFRFTYKGFATEEKKVRYVLKTEDGRIFPLYCGETVNGVTLLGTDASQKTLTVRDERLHQTFTLELGKPTFLPNRFEGTLRYRDKSYSFSEQPLFLDEQTQLTPMRYEGRLYFLEQTKDKDPYIRELQKP